MRLARYRFADGDRLARIEGQEDAATVADLGIASSLTDWLAPDRLDALATLAPVATAALDTGRLLPPLVPPLFLGVGLNYRDHAAETGRAVPDWPALFVKAPGALAPPFGTVPARETLDYEGELGVVIGLPAHRVTPADARAHVAGYLVVNDLTVRSLIRPDNLVLGKGGPGQAPIGPWLTTADAVPDPQALAIATTVNRAPRQHGSTAAMHRGVAELIAWISAALPLPAGTVIATGSPAGSGAGLAPPRWLRPGDTVRVAIAGLGHIEQRVTG